MTAWGTIDLAVEAMRRGARDFIQKPWENERLLTVLKSQVELRRALRQGRRLEEENRVLRSPATGSPDHAVPGHAAGPGTDRPGGPVRRPRPDHPGSTAPARRWWPGPCTRVSARSAKPLVAVNLGGLSEGVFVSEMFGHVKGAFTDARSDRIGRFELADGGTLLLDEVTSIPVSQQANLLRVLESGRDAARRLLPERSTSTCGCFSATNADLKREVERGRFREDLLFRLKHGGDPHPHPYETGTRTFSCWPTTSWGRYNQKYRKRLDGFSEPALAALAHYSWPGNVRELKHVVERSVLLAPGVLHLGRGSEPAGGLAFFQSAGK